MDHANISSEDHSLITYLDQNEQVRSHHEAMKHRLKNRERQRRYRARKRLAAERKMAYTPQPLQYVEVDTKKGHTSLPLPKEIKRRKWRKKEVTIHQFTPAQIELPLNGTPQDFATRVHSWRDWKRDARRAHKFKEQDFKVNGTVIPVVASVSGSQVQTFASGMYPTLEKGCHPGGAIIDFNEVQKVMPSRRHWKEEARNKKI